MFSEIFLCDREWQALSRQEGVMGEVIATVLEFIFRVLIEASITVCWWRKKRN